MTILKQAKFKSKEWASSPVIADSMFREYDLRSSMISLEKGGSVIFPGINVEGYRVLGQAYGTYVLNNKGKKIVVCNDYRSYSRGNAFAFITGVLSTGVDVIDIGLGITPMLYFSQYHFKSPFGAMITASHNDNGWTGLKIAKGFSKTFSSEDIFRFKKSVYKNQFKKGKGYYTSITDFSKIYISDIVRKYRKKVGKRKLTVVVATGNGGAGLFLPEVFKKLGAKVIENHCELDWDFPYFNPNPEDMSFLKDLGKKVVKEKADFGVAADGDGDRFGLVDEKGKVVFADRVGLAIAREIAKKGSHVVIDVKSTGAFKKDSILKELGVTIHFSKTGHSYVKELSQVTKSIAGFEKSGHFFLGAEYGRLYDDACISSAIFLMIMSKTKDSVSTLISKQLKSYQTPTMSPSVKDDVEKYVIVSRLTKELQSKKTFAGRKIVSVLTINGIRLELEDGSFVLVRASSNQPVLTVVIESFISRKDVKILFEELFTYLKKEGIQKEHFDQLL